MSEYCPLCQGDPRRREHAAKHLEHEQPSHPTDEEARMRALAEELT